MYENITKSITQYKYNAFGLFEKKKPKNPNIRDKFYIYILLIMVTYNCETCTFNTINKKDFNRHCKTNKHIIKVKESDKIDTIKADKLTRSCPKCNKIFSTKSNMGKHLIRFHNNNIGIDNPKTGNKNDGNIVCKKISCNKKKDKTAGKQGVASSYPDISPMLAFDGVNLCCEYCEKKYNHRSSKSRHEKNCAKRLIEKQKMELLEEKLKMKDQIIAAHENTGKVANKSLSLLGYLMTQFEETPPLEAIARNEIKAITNNKNNDYFTAAQILICEYKHDNLANFIGQEIIKLYKKDDLSEQSIHTSDVSRFNYIVMDAKEDRKNWTKDIKGLTINEKIIIPILGDIYRLMNKYQNKITNYDSEKEFDTEEAQLSNKIKDEIDDFNLHREIHKIIAPYFKTIPDIDLSIQELHKN
jgi:hypothetical protein